METRKTLIIGNEYDHQLIEKLENILLKEGAVLTGKNKRSGRISGLQML